MKKVEQRGCSIMKMFNTLRPRQNGRHFADDIFKCIFLNVNVWIPIKISMKFVPKGPINNIQALFQIMAWRSTGDKPLSETMMVSLPTHICVTRPQWVKSKQCTSGIIYCVLCTNNIFIVTIFMEIFTNLYEPSSITTSHTYSRVNQCRCTIISHIKFTNQTL